MSIRDVLWRVADIAARDAIVIAGPEVGAYAQVLSEGGALYQAIGAGQGADRWSADAEGDAFASRTDGSVTTAATTSAEYQTAVTNMPDVIGAGDVYRINLGAGTFTWQDLQAVVEGNVVISGSTSVIESGTAAASTGANVIKKSGGGLTPNVHQGKFIRTTGGTGAGQKRLIAENDANGWVPAKAFSPAPDTTTTYEIYESNSVLDVGTVGGSVRGMGPTNPLLDGSNLYPGYVFDDVKIDCTGPGSVHFSDGTFFFYGTTVEGASGAAISFAGCNAQFGAYPALALALGLATTATEYDGYGLGQTGAGSITYSGFQASLNGYAVLKQFVAAATGTQLTLSGGAVTDGINSSQYGGRVVLSGAAANKVLVGADVNMSLGGQIEMLNTDFYGTTWPALKVAVGATALVFPSVELRNTPTSPTRTILADPGGSVYFVGAPDASWDNSSTDGMEVFALPSSLTRQVSDFGAKGDGGASLNGARIERSA